MNFHAALKLFEHTLAQAECARPDIHAGMRKLADPATIEQANEAVSTGLALGRRIWLTSDLPQWVGKSEFAPIFIDFFDEASR